MERLICVSVFRNWYQPGSGGSVLEYRYCCWWRWWTMIPNVRRWWMVGDIVTSSICNRATNEFESNALKIMTFTITNLNREPRSNQMYRCVMWKLHRRKRYIDGVYRYIECIGIEYWWYDMPVVGYWLRPFSNFMPILYGKARSLLWVKVSYW